MPPVTGKPVQPGKPVVKPTVAQPPVLKQGGRVVRYPEIKTEICKAANAISVERAKELLGWQTENEAIALAKKIDPNVNEDAVRFGANYFLTDVEGNKVRLKNNENNRPWSEGVSKAYTQDILKHHWRLNGETVIIGKTGRILSGQHRLIALVLAEQERTGPNKAHWEAEWSGPITLECVLVFGVDETPDVTRTLDNVKSRTLTDVICADTELFGSYSIEDRKTLARMLDYTIRLMWKRTREMQGFTTKMTHSEALDYRNRHPKILECVEFMFKEDKAKEGVKDSGGKISNYLYPGNAAALLYLMGCSATPQSNVEEYYVSKMNVGFSEEKFLNWDNLKKAKLFWSQLANGDSSLKQLTLARRPIAGSDDTLDSFSGFIFMGNSDDEEISGGNLNERIGVLIKAWNLYAEDQPVKDLQLTYTEQKDELTGKNFYHLIEFPTVRGGIDQGEERKEVRKKKDKEEKDEKGEANDKPKKKSSTSKVTNLDEVRKQWEEDKTHYAGHILFYKSRVSANYLVYFDDAETMGGITGHKVRPHPTTGVTQVVVGEKELDDVCRKLRANSHDVLISTNVNGNIEWLPWSDPESVEEEATSEVSADETFPLDSDDSDVPPDGEGEVSEVQEEQQEEESTDPEPVPVRAPEEVIVKPKKIVRKK